MGDRVAFRKTSLVDFPGRVAAVLFFPGCDFACPYCHNAGLVDPARAEGELDELGEFYAHLDRRRAVLSGAVLSGGEPLLRADLPKVAAALRARGLAVMLDTNGSFPGRIEEVRPDYVALDLKTAPAAYARVAPSLPGAGERALESLRLLRALAAEGRLEFEVRITCAPGVLEPGDLAALAEELEAGDRVVLQAFRPGGCLDPAWDSLAPYSPAEMESFREAIARSAPGARIRGP